MFLLAEQNVSPFIIKFIHYLFRFACLFVYVFVCQEQTVKEKGSLVI